MNQLSREINPRISSITKMLKEQGFQAYPSAWLTIKDYVRRAARTGTIQSAAEITMCAAAFLVAADEQAQKRGTRRVTAADVKKGWQVQLRNCPGNLPPHRCVRRSILERQDELRNILPVLDQTLRNLQ